MKKTTIYILLVSLILSISLPYLSNTNKTLANTGKVTVSAEIVNLREGPGLTYQIIEKTKKGDELSILDESGDWYLVKKGNTVGWIASWLVNRNDHNNDPKSKNTLIISQVDNLNIRQEPSIASPVLAQLFTGNEANYIKEENGWIQIKYGQNLGWVSKDYVTIISDEQEVENSKVTTTDAYTHFRINVDAVNVRKKADLNSKKLSVVMRDETFKILEEKNGWVKIEYKKGKKGWVNTLYGKITNDIHHDNEGNQDDKDANETITIIYNGTNLRTEPSTASKVVERVDAGNTYEVIGTENDWFKIKINNKDTAYVANWVVKTNDEHLTNSSENKTIEKTKRKKGTLNGLTIVIDPGHGGNDHGTTGVRGTDEKDITLLTAEKLKSKLIAAGANVVLTRESDTYVALRKRVSISHQVAADAFISLHYDATENSSVNGITTYYTNSYQKELAQYVHKGLAKKVDLRDREVQPGNYLVLRENKQKAILIELGFLSNASEERKITTDYYREKATLGIYEGIINYFDDQL